MYKAIVEAVKEFKESRNSDSGSGSTTPTNAVEEQKMFFTGSLKKNPNENLRYIINFTNELGEETN